MVPFEGDEKNRMGQGGACDRGGLGKPMAESLRQLGRNYCRLGTVLQEVLGCLSLVAAGILLVMRLGRFEQQGIENIFGSDFLVGVVTLTGQDGAEVGNLWFCESATSPVVGVVENHCRYECRREAYIGLPEAVKSHTHSSDEIAGRQRKTDPLKKKPAEAGLGVEVCVICRASNHLISCGQSGLLPQFCVSRIARKAQAPKC